MDKAARTSVGGVSADDVAAGRGITARHCGRGHWMAAGDHCLRSHGGCHCGGRGRRRDGGEGSRVLPPPRMSRGWWRASSRLPLWTSPHGRSLGTASLTRLSGGRGSGGPQLGERRYGLGRGGGRCRPRQLRRGSVNESQWPGRGHGTGSGLRELPVLG